MLCIIIIFENIMQILEDNKVYNLMPEILLDYEIMFRVFPIHKQQFMEAYECSALELELKKNAFGS